MDAFFAAVDVATAEYHEDYVPLLVKMRESRAEKAQLKADLNVAKLKADLAAAGDVVVDARPEAIPQRTHDDLPTGPDIGPDDAGLE
jgi:hypothetical protein